MFLSLHGFPQFGVADLDPGNLTAATQRLIEERPNNPGDVQGLRDGIQQRILQLESERHDELAALCCKKEMCILKNTFNAIAPVMCLPPEVLASIFVLQKYSPPKGAKWVPYSSLAVSHVCRHWRAIAVECAELWTTFDCSNNQLDLVEMMLRRSKAAPLSVKFDMQEKNMGSKFSLFRRCLQRLASVELRCVEQNNTFGISDVFLHFPKVMPRLESVEIYAPNSHNTHDEIPDSFLGGPVHSNLQSLSITGFIPWKAIPPAPSLTSLTLRHTCKDSRATQGLAAAGFLEFLHEAHNLQELDIAHLLPSDSYPLQPIPLRLPSLQRLQIEDEPPIITNFFKSLKAMAAPQTSIIISKCRSTPFAACISECVSALSRVWTGVSHSDRFRGDIEAVDLDSWVAGGRAVNPLIQCFFGGGECPTLSVRFRSGVLQAPNTLGRAFDAVTQPFGLSEVHSLSLSANLDPPVSTWESILQPMPKLRRITLTNTRLVGFSEILEGRSRNPDLPPLCVALSHIHIRHGQRSYLADNLAAPLISLAELFSKRAGTPSALEELRVSSSSIRRGTYDKLMTFTPTLNIATEDLKVLDK